MSAKRYYLRQAESCIRLAEAADGPEASRKLRSAAADYLVKARFADESAAVASQPILHWELATP